MLDQSGISLTAVLIPLLFGIGGAAIADYKGRRALLWFVISFFLPFMVLVLPFLKPIVLPNGRWRECRHCGGLIKARVSVCPHCQCDQETKTCCEANGKNE
ncbi:hypothetical protein [Oleidesulfovibrio sp.]|uniref:hypothetical protein n=1 Tax=Oleidesulfovibrio sp. TaxID=2909707 RepID=UPI003A876080